MPSNRTVVVAWILVRAMQPTRSCRFFHQFQQFQCSNSSSNVICPRQVHPLFRIICTVFLLSWPGGILHLFVCALCSSACGPNKKDSQVHLFLFFRKFWSPIDSLSMEWTGNCMTLFAKGLLWSPSRESIYNFGWNLCRKWIRYFSVEGSGGGVGYYRKDYLGFPFPGRRDDFEDDCSNDQNSTTGTK